MKRRIFIAIQIPEEVKNAAEFYLKPFFNDRNMRIPKKGDWHITLVFCGYLDDQEIETLKEIVKNIALEFRPFEFVPQKILFAPPSHPRMIWLSFVKSLQFADLKNEIENAIVSCQKEGLFKNFYRENREPNPHLTLARFKEKYFPNIKKFLPEEGIDLTNETAPFPVKSLDIIQSHLSRSGADYALLDEIKLSQ